MGRAKLEMRLNQLQAQGPQHISGSETPHFGDFGQSNATYVNPGSSPFLPTPAAPFQDTDFSNVTHSPRFTQDEHTPRLSQFIPGGPFPGKDDDDDQTIVDDDTPEYNNFMPSMLPPAAMTNKEEPSQHGRAAYEYIPRHPQMPSNPFAIKEPNPHERVPYQYISQHPQKPPNLSNDTSRLIQFDPAVFHQQDEATTPRLTQFMPIDTYQPSAYSAVRPFSANLTQCIPDPYRT